MKSRNAAMSRRTFIGLCFGIACPSVMAGVIKRVQASQQRGNAVLLRRIPAIPTPKSSGASQPPAPIATELTRPEEVIRFDHTRP